MINYLDRKVSEKELQAIFKNNIDRSIFISGYPYFEDDGNRRFYQQFIEDNITSSKPKVRGNAIELSLVIDYYKNDFFFEIRKILYSSRNEFFKLACMDWLFSFFDKIPPTDFLEINEYVLKKAKSELLTIQSILNMLLFQNTIELVEMLINHFKYTTDPAIFYRFANGMEAPQLAKCFIDQKLVGIINVLQKNSNIRKEQKDELIEKINLFNSYDLF